MTQTKKTSKNSKDNDDNDSKEFTRRSGIKDETRYGIFVVVSFVLALFFVLAAFGFGGPAGAFIYKVFTLLFGVGYYLVPVLLALLGISFIQAERPEVGLLHTISAGVFFFSILGVIDIAWGAHNGGLIGKVIAFPFMKLFDIYTSIIFLGAFLIISLIILFDSKPTLMPLILGIVVFFKKLFSKKVIVENTDETTSVVIQEAAPETEDVEEISTGEKIKKALGLEKKDDDIEIETRVFKKMSGYVPPSLSLLEKDKGKPNVGDVKANSNIIKRTLQNFGILVEMDEITIGPTVTRYALKPAEGVKLSRIVGLQNDLALALAAHPIRIEAPIPGKSLVGIEIPNKVKSMVGLATLLADDKFQNASKPLLAALGRGLSGKAHFANVAKMPHLLIAGTTGSGKSVTIHSLITSLLYRNGPEEMRFIMIDPKRVELTLYNKIPHLLTPVITEPKKSILALKWAAKEMDRRYDILESESVRDLESYHNTVCKDKKDAENLPYIVIIIDELADIMQAYPRELESGIVRLAQMSRAVGIHLVLSTQRPSVNVITGIIKANVPARLALQVSSQIDSRTILDQGGAEKLLGAGDMLYLSGEMSQPERIQSAYISEEEVKKVVKYLVDSYKDEIVDNIELSGSISPDKSAFDSQFDDDSSADDEMYEEARIIVVQAGKASTSYLQRKLKVGYARAARLIDMLEERGIVSAGDGAKPREVLEKSMGAERAEFE